MTVRTQRGFSLAELLISMSIMLVIAGAATTALMKMTGAQATLWNRTQMHSGIRGATEVLQQEVGQAGRIAIPNMVKLSAGITAGTRTVTLLCRDAAGATVTCESGTTSASGLFIGQKLVIDAGCFNTAVTPCESREETVTIIAPEPTATEFTAAFLNDHAANAPVQVRGVFATGVIPPAASPSSYANGSTGEILKLYGDINADGKMVYVEYECQYGAIVGGVEAPGNLYRNQMSWNATAPSAAPTASQILLSNIMRNPGSPATPCFTYQQAPVLGQYYVIDVAITLTVQTQLIDPVTKQFQLETKALLNVSPRNVFHAWSLASLGINHRIHPIPPQIAALLP